MRSRGGANEVIAAIDDAIGVDVDVHLPEEFNKVDSPIRLERYRNTQIPAMGQGRGAQRKAWIINKMRGRPNTDNEGNPIAEAFIGKKSAKEYFSDDPEALEVIDMMPNSSFITDRDYRLGDILNDIFERIYRYSTYHERYPNMPLYLPGIDYDPAYGYEVERYEGGVNYNFIPDKFTVDQNGYLHLVPRLEGGKMKGKNARKACKMKKRKTCKTKKGKTCKTKKGKRCKTKKVKSCRQRK